jgi:hypothetical protein
MIKKGDKFRCIKTLLDNGNFLYIKGRVYRSNKDNYIDSEQGCYDQCKWSDGSIVDEDFLKYFIPYISNKRGGYGRKEGKKV